MTGGLSRITVSALFAVALCVAMLTLVACGGGEATTGGAVETGGVIGEPLTTLTDAAAGSESTVTSDAVQGVDAGLVGKWHSDQTGETHEYTADGRLIVTSGAGVVTEMNYTADGSTISYLIDGAVVYSGTYAVDDDVLTQVDPDISGTVFFDRVE